jgi:tripartite-type tricarboxylate transporter receptor subunit TctC
MPVARRDFLNFAALGIALPAFAGQARAESYPDRPVHIVAGYPPGAAPDIIPRLIGQALGTARPAIRRRQQAGRG